MKRLIVLANFLGLLLPIILHAQSLGVFCWRLNPFVDILCFDIEDKGFVFELTGTQGIATFQTSSHGAANLNRSTNRYHLGFTSHFPNGFHGQFFVSLNTESLNGTWTDNFGNSGDFFFQGAGPLPPGLSDGTDGDYFSHITSLR
ncbi:hypothetical protein [Nitrosomonas sp. Nm34]|uniref:hypothetical protein n=1 Tax=Nitrosomonas sp. Nm34 TaxID=1881055 RepID=UPI0008E44ED4|nr:hypothetical protein [Nitrosomonas sp. Nm34]SFI27332.1 hypothetical protein SAMN05428978_10049 [Nitrosomonas sp. Nm34]